MSTTKSHGHVSNVSLLIFLPYSNLSPGFQFQKTWKNYLPYTQTRELWIHSSSHFLFPRYHQVCWRQQVSISEPPTSVFHSVTLLLAASQPHPDYCNKLDWSPQGQSSPWLAPLQSMPHYCNQRDLCWHGKIQLELPWWLSSKESSCQCRRYRFSPSVGKIPWRRKRQPTPVFLLGEFQEQRVLSDYSPWGCKEVDMDNSLLYGPTLTSIHDYWKNHSFDYMDLCHQSNVSAF